MPAEWLKAVPFMKKIPAVNENDNSSAEDARLNYKATMKAIMLIWTSPKNALACSSWLEDRCQSGPKRTCLGNETEFDVAPVTVQNLDDDWVCAYILACDKLAWTEGKLSRAKAYDPQAPKLVLCNVLNISLTLKLGEACKSKIVLKLAFDKRRGMAYMEGRGELPQGKTQDDLLLPSGQVDWGLLGNYVTEHELAGNYVLHKPTGDRAEITTAISTDWWLDLNECDMRCVLMKSKADKVKVHRYFANGQGPFRQKLLTGQCKEWDRLLKEAVTEQKAKEEKAMDGLLESPDKATLHDAVQLKKQETVKRAREALAKRNEDRALQRRVYVTPKKKAKVAEEEAQG